MAHSVQISGMNIGEKRGKGRPKGALSLISIRFGDLKDHFSDDTFIPIGRKFLDSIGLINVLSSTPPKTKEKEKPQITLIKFDSQ